jgi:hypothetical protein
VSAVSPRTFRNQNRIRVISVQRSNAFSGQTMERDFAASLCSLRSRFVAFNPCKVSRSLDSLVRVKPIWSADSGANILTCLGNGPVYQRLRSARKTTLESGSFCRCRLPLIRSATRPEIQKKHAIDLGLLTRYAFWQEHITILLNVRRRHRLEPRQPLTGVDRSSNAPPPQALTNPGRTLLEAQ